MFTLCAYHIALGRPFQSFGAAHVNERFFKSGKTLERRILQ